MSKETCPCRVCGTPTDMLGTKLCDPCWQIRNALEDAARRGLLIIGRRELDAIPWISPELYALMRETMS